MKAYKVWCDDVDSHEQRVVFAARGKDVNRNIIDCDCEYITRHVHRAPKFDKYAPGPVTIQMYLAEGWHYECAGCYLFVYGDDCPVIINGHVYHSRECVVKHRVTMERFVGAKRVHESISTHIAAIDEWIAENV